MDTRDFANKIPVIAILGPTASGKTALSVELAKALSGEVLSFDSMQIYKGMDIATAKPSNAEMQGIPHYMISEVEPNEAFSVAKYKERADEIIADIHARNKTVIMVGGTGLYMDTVLKNIELLKDETPNEVRENLREELNEYGPTAMYEKLKEIDPKAARNIHENNTGRVLRALEIYYSTGHTISYQVENSRLNESPYYPIYIGLTAKDRQYLYERINKRVDMMLSKGLLDEAREFVGNPIGATAKQAIGLKELAPFINGERTLDECVDHLKQETRRYAKRQLTWFRKNPEVNWLYIDEMNGEELVAEALRIVNSKICKEV
ncbi:MAG: tRNA (adenosine(37)-N6)-dimethylallyltransferase MiaA [Oscillospiraceae bacterium]|nr:tRNA (adenosine(37)-N6)-dimethylallyltransferase MiaA [Oscillospiraceae bacterium]